MIKLSKKEKQLVELLRTNARLSNKDLADMVGLSESDVALMLDKWHKDGTILKHITVFNEEKIQTGHGAIRAVVEVSVRPEKKTGFDAIAKRICKHPNVVDHYLISGSYDFLIIVEGHTLQEISSFVSNTLASIENVRSTGTHFILKKYKENNIEMGFQEPENRLMVSA